MAGLDVKVSQLGEVVVASDNDLLNLVTYDEQNQTYVSGKVKARTLKSYMVDDLEISDLYDTTITTPTDDDGLVYDSTSQKWKNVPIMTQEAQNVLGAKNILYHTLTDKVSDGVTYHVNDDRSITATITGTHSSDTNMPITNDWSGFDISAYIGKTLICSGGQGIGSPFGFSIQILDSSRNLITYMPYGEEYTLPNNAKYCMPMLAITSAATGSYTFKPMIRLKGTDSTYVPYAKTNGELTEDATTEDFTSSVMFTDTATISVFKKVGNIITFSFRGSSRTAIAVNDTLFTLPTGYRPKDNILIPFIIEGVAYGAVIIYTNGTASVSTVSSTSFTSGRVIMQGSFAIN